MRSFDWGVVRMRVNGRKYLKEYRVGLKGPKANLVRLDKKLFVDFEEMVIAWTTELAIIMQKGELI